MHRFPMKRGCLPHKTSALGVAQVLMLMASAKAWARAADAHRLPPKQITRATLRRSALQPTCRSCMEQGLHEIQIHLQNIALVLFPHLGVA